MADSARHSREIADFSVSANPPNAQTHAYLLLIVSKTSICALMKYFRSAKSCLCRPAPTTLRQGGESALQYPQHVAVSSAVRAHRIFRSLQQLHADVDESTSLRA